MRPRLEPLALDTSVIVPFFLEEDMLHEEAFKLVESVFEGYFACISAVNVAEIGYVLERVTEDKEFAQNCMHAVCYEMPIDVLPLSWEFMRKLAHLKAVNAISFCDNATLAAANLQSCKALFTREKEIVAKAMRLTGPEIMFLEEL
ncbi:MAG: PIN domain-containing protein [Methanophagales archaeon]|nr:PIN domain-containing protein [Methanophagales archaeon]